MKVMQKQFSKFNTERKGYSKKEVDAYVENVERRHKETVGELKEKLDDLANENLELKKRVQELESKSENVSKALLLAGEKAKEQEIVLYKKMKNEETRLQVFSKRWTTFMNEQNSSKDVLSQKYRIEEYLKCAEEELVAELNKHFTYIPPISVQEAQFISEAKRLGRLEATSFFD